MEKMILNRWRQRRHRLTGARLLPFKEYFDLFDVSYNETRKLKVNTFKIIPRLSLKIHSTKGNFLPILIGEQLGMIIDIQTGQFRSVLRS